MHCCVSVPQWQFMPVTSLHIHDSVYDQKFLRVKICKGLKFLGTTISRVLLIQELFSISNNSNKQQQILNQCHSLKYRMYTLNGFYNMLYHCGTLYIAVYLFLQCRRHMVILVLTVVINCLLNSMMMSLNLVITHLHRSF